MLFSRKIRFICAALVLGVYAHSQGLAGPRAEISTTSWQLDVEFFDPQRITVRMPRTGQEQTFWYVLYQVTNHTGQEIDFFPSFRLVTDDLQVIEGGADVPTAVYDAVAARHKLEYPFFVPPGKVMGSLLQGAENARVSAAVFTPFNLSAGRFTIYMSGFAGHIERLRNPVFDPKKPEADDNQRFFLLRRTLSVTYRLPGDAQTRGFATPVRILKEWVNR